MRHVVITLLYAYIQCIDIAMRQDTMYYISQQQVFSLAIIIIIIFTVKAPHQNPMEACHW